MNINDMKSNLKMQQFYFSECSLKREPVIKDGDYNINLKKEIQSAGEHTYDVTLKTEVSKNDVELLVVAKARFILEADDYINEETVINRNTIAIMFPFVRSQVTLMTSQPAMSPVVLPPVNTARFEENQ